MAVLAGITWPLPRPFHARRADAKPGDPEDETFVTGEDPLDLRDQIRHAQALTIW